MGFLDDILDSVMPGVIALFRDDNVTLSNSDRTYDPITGWSGSSDTTVSLKITPYDEYTIKEIDGTNIQRGDLKTLLAALDLGSFEIQANLTNLVDGTSKYKVIKATPISGGDRAGLYELQLRGVE